MGFGEGFWVFCDVMSDKCYKIDIPLFFVNG